METDVVVIGSGGTGLAAALTAAQGGAKVMVFEKQRSLGGTTNFFEGTFAVESDFQRRQYVTYSRDDAFKAMMEYSHWRANARLVRAFVNESAGTIHWMRENGVPFIDVTINMPDRPRTYHTIEGNGAGAVKALVTAAKEKGVVFKTGAPVKAILTQGGRVTGVVAEHDGEDVEIAAKAVVIGTGGYLNNDRWVKKYTGLALGENVVPVGNMDNTGDGIRMAWESGADEEGMGLLEMLGMGPIGPDLPPKSNMNVLALQPNLWVDPGGVRFCDEGIAFYDTSCGNVGARFKQGFIWSVLDESIKNWNQKNGIVRNLAIENPPGTRPLGFDKEVEAALERNSTEVVVADSIEALAQGMGVDPQVLTATINEYNGYCEKGHDELFAKDRKFLMPLKGPKYYAFRVRTVALGTLGGIKINEKMEVVAKKGGIVPGLYAGGNDAGGMWGDSYPIMHCSGASSAFAINSGRIAGKNILKHLGLV